MARELIEVARCDFPHDGVPPEATVFADMDIRVGVLRGLMGDAQPYELELCAEHGEALLRHGRRRQPAEPAPTVPEPARPAEPAPAGAARPAPGWSERQERRAHFTEVREWARRHLYQVADRGRIPDEIIAKYDAAMREEAAAAEAAERAAKERGEAAGRGEAAVREVTEQERQQRERAAQDAAETARIRAEREQVNRNRAIMAWARVNDLGFDLKEGRPVPRNVQEAYDRAMAGQQEDQADAR